MIAFLKRLWRAAPVATSILVVALGLGAFFAVRMVAFWVYWHDPANREQEIAGWMTPGYVAMSWQVPRHALLDALEANRPPRGRPKTIDELAASRGISTDALIADIKTAIEALRAATDRGDREQ